jgi:hypothetical protein
MGIKENPYKITIAASAVRGFESIKVTKKI